MSQPNNDPQIILLSMRLYSWFLRLFPKEFQQEYGEEILKDFRHCCRNVYAQRGACGVLQSWPSTFTRVIADMGAEHLSEAAHREKKRLSMHQRTFRPTYQLFLAVLAAILAGVSIASILSTGALSAAIGAIATISLIVAITVENKHRIKGVILKSNKQKRIYRQIPNKK